MTRLCVGAIEAYQRLISPLLGRRCRYYPSCSAYAVGALKQRGLLVGTYLALWRLASCHPWAHGGVDFVPAQGLRSGRHAADARPHLGA